MSCLAGRYVVSDVPPEFWIGGARTSATGNSAGAFGPFDANAVASVDLPD